MRTTILALVIAASAACYDPMLVETTMDASADSTDCEVTPIWTMSVCSTNRMPLGSRPIELVHLYADGEPIPDDSWYSPDGGHTVIIPECLPKPERGDTILISVSIGCVATSHRAGAPQSR